ncbi:MAG: AAA family ATPase, partial [Syntrophobacterales bacterium]
MVLAELQIHNFAIIAELSVSFNPGLTVITGETGAGKSILVNAVNLLLGSRGSADLIRSGSKEATVAALFNLSHEGVLAAIPQISNKLSGPEVLVKRTLSTAGRNRVHINDQLGTVGGLAELCRGLVSISGQHEHQLFLEPEAHLEIIDRFGGLEKEQEAYAQTFGELRRLKGELVRLNRLARERQEKEELRRFQLEEIDRARIQMDEEVHLEEERQRLRHVENLQQGAATAHQRLYSESGAVLEEVSQCQRILADLGRLDDALKPLAEALEGIRHQVEDVSITLRDYSQKIQADPARLEWVEERLHTLKRLMSKYDGSTRTVLAQADTLRNELQAAENDEIEIEAKEKDLERVRQQALAEAMKLSENRRDTASRFCRAVEESLVSLDMPKCRFEVRFDLEEGAEGAKAHGVNTESIRVDEYLLNEKG